MSTIYKINQNWAYFAIELKLSGICKYPNNSENFTKLSNKFQLSKVLYFSTAFASTIYNKYFSFHYKTVNWKGCLSIRWNKGITHHALFEELRDIRTYKSEQKVTSPCKKEVNFLLWKMLALENTLTPIVAPPARYLSSSIDISRRWVTPPVVSHWLVRAQARDSHNWK